jgi:hypothetical protein
MVARDGWMERQKRIQGGRASLLRTYNQKLGQLLARLVGRPNGKVTFIEARILRVWTVNYLARAND